MASVCTRAAARRATLAALVLALAALWAGPALAHCEIPCGIYGDETRFTIMREHIATIEKSMQSANELGAAQDKNWNQLVRWIDNKGLHAEKLQEVAWQYFLTQRIKLPKGEADRGPYLERLELLHRILVYAMKCKQTTDLKWVDKLRQTVDAFEKAYLQGK